MATPLPPKRGTSLLLPSPGLLSTPFGLALRSPEEGAPSPEIEVTVNEARLSLEQYMGMAGLIKSQADKGPTLHEKVKDKVDSAAAEEARDLISAVWPSQQPQQQKQGQKRSSPEPTNHLEEHSPSNKRRRLTTHHHHRHQEQQQQQQQQQDANNGRHYLDTMRTLEEQVAKARRDVEQKEKAALAEEYETANAVKFAEQTWGALHQIHMMLQMGHSANTNTTTTYTRLQQSIAAQQQQQWQMPGHARFPTSMMPNVEGASIRSPFYGDLMEAIFMFSSPPENQP